VEAIVSARISWFQQTIKVAYTEDGNSFTWENAKECLKKKFNNTSVIACNQVLFHYRQKSDQSLYLNLWIS
jgi:hypothetical protein